MTRITGVLLLLVAHAAHAVCEDCRWTPLPEAMLLGEGLELSVSRPLADHGTRLSALPLDAFGADFDLYERTVGAGAESEDMRLLLYPRRAGKLSLTLPGQGTRFIDVRDDGPVQVVFSWHAEPPHWTLRRSSRLTLEACTRGALRWQRPEVAFATGLSLIPLDTQAATARADPRGCVPQRWSWSATPTLGGRLSLDLGMLEASRHGTRLRFPTPVFEAEVASVPVWLPPGIAIEAPEIVEDRRPTEGRVGEPMAWHLRIRADYSESTLVALLDAQLVGSGAWARYPAQITATRDAAPSPLWDIRLTARPETGDALTLPSLSWPWFDATTGELRHARLEAGSVAVGDPVRERLRLIGLLAATLLSFALGVGVMRHRLRGWLAHRRLIARVSRASDAQAMHTALVGESGNRTTAGWMQGFMKLRVAPELPELLEALDTARFSGRDVSDFIRLRRELVRCLRSSARRPVRSRNSGRLLRQPRVPAG